MTDVVHALDLNQIPTPSVSPDIRIHRAKSLWPMTPISTVFLYETEQYDMLLFSERKACSAVIEIFVVFRSFVA
jgi:hypothetical protein